MVVEQKVKGKEYREIKKDGDYVLNLHRGQSKAWESKARFPVILSGRQSGKTIFSGDWLYREIQEKGEGDYLVGSATFPLMDKKLLPEMENLFCRVFKWGKYRDSDKMIISNNEKSKIFFFTGINSEAIESATAKGAVLDECLAPETMIDTEYGSLPISEIVNKRLRLRVWSFDTLLQKWELKPIIRWIKLPQKENFKRFGGLRITGNHKIWTDKGYVSIAQMLSACYTTEKVEGVTDENVPELSKRTNQSRPEKVLLHKVLLEMAYEAKRSPAESLGEKKIVSSKPRESESLIRGQKEVLCQSCKQTVESTWWGDYSTYQTSREYSERKNQERRTVETRWKWSSSQLETGKTCSSIGLAERICSHNRETIQTSSLQDRCGRTELENSDRSRECCQSSKDSMVQGQWVDISSFLESNGGDMDGGRSQDGYVYNLEVESNHNYVADNLLVSNCGQKTFRLGTWEAVQGRLAIWQGRALLCTTPYDFGWLKTQIYDKWRAGDKTFDVISFESIENPAFPVEEFERLRKVLAPWKFEMFYRGRFTKPAGLVYDVFDSSVDVIDRFPIPPEWPVYVGHDFGIANPAALFFAMNPRGEIFAFHEYLPGRGRSVYEHVQQFNSIVTGRHVVSRKGGNWTTEEETRQAYTAQGWAIGKPKWKEVSVQIEKVYGLNALHSVKIFRDLTHYIDQKLSFSYQLDEDTYEPTDKYDSESEYHLLAAERYLLSDFTPETVVKEPEFAEVMDLRPARQGTAGSLFTKVQDFRGK